MNFITLQTKCYNSYMKRRTAVCIFAHPDDEAFGPAGTIHKLTKDYDVYIICATKGEIGQDALHIKKPLSQVRADELENSASILGIKKVFFLGFVDGALSNSQYHKLAGYIESHLKKLKPELILTMNPNGGSGHIDHIVVSMVCSYVFERLKFVKKIMYTASTDEYSKAASKFPYFIYRPPGIPRSQVDEIIDVSDVWDIKLAAMQAHKSQIEDYKRITKIRKNLPREEYFMVKER